MIRSAIVATLSVGAAAFCAEPGGATYVYEVVADRSIGLVPVPLRGALDSHRERVIEQARMPCSRSDETTAESIHPHTFRIPAGYGPDGAGPQRLERLIAEGANGLPRHLVKHVEHLVEAFQKGDADAIARRAGDVIHLSTDAALPFRVTGGHPSSVDQRVVASLDAAAERLRHEVRIYSGRYSEVAALSEAVATVLWETYIAERQLAETSVRQSEDSGIPALQRIEHENVLQVVEARLESAALFASGLIGYAWTAAGRPEVARADHPSDRSGPPGLIPGAGFVGSRHSLVYHRSDCPHAGRIKPRNLVQFATLAAAEKVGRTPCRHCFRPDSVED